MFLYKTGINFIDSKYLLKEHGIFLKDIMDEALKQLKIEALENQILMAEAVRVASLAKKNDFKSWMNSKDRQIWKLRKTEEEKEKEALKNWDALYKNQKNILTKDKAPKKKGILDKLLRK